MTAAARRALGVIRECIESDHYALTVHFSRRMAQRGLFWPDVEAAIFDPRDVQSQGMDEDDRAKWIVAGQAANGEEIEIVCAVEVDETATVFITLYWED